MNAFTRVMVGIAGHHIEPGTRPPQQTHKAMITNNERPLKLLSKDI